MFLIKFYIGLRFLSDRYCLFVFNYRMSSYKVVKKVGLFIVLMRGFLLRINSLIFKLMVDCFIRIYSMMVKIVIFFKENMIF